MYYFEPNDYALSIELNKSIKKLNEDNKISSINDAIERYIIDKYLNNKNYQKFFIENLDISLMTVRQNNKRVFSRYLNNIKPEDFLKISKSVNSMYISEFLEICASYKIYLKVTPEILLKILSYDQFYLSDFLKQKRLVDFSNEKLRKLLLQNGDIVELLIEHESQQSTNRIHLPLSISQSDLNFMIQEYVESKNPNPNILEKIYRLKPDKIKLTDKVKFLAMKRHQNEIDKILQEKSAAVIKHEYMVGASEELSSEEFFEFNIDDNKFIYNFNKNIIANNLQTDEVIGVITYLLSLVDQQYRIVGLNNKSKISVLEQAFSNATSSSYSPGRGMDSLNNLINLIVMYYVNFLEKNNANIEEVMEYFFTQYLEEKFTIKNYVFNAPTRGTNLKEKIKLLASELDSVVKQYHVMDDDRFISQEFVNFTSNVPAYKDIRSRVDGKNVYLNSEVSKAAIHALLNDQHLLYYYDVQNQITLESAILNNNAYFHKLEQYQQNVLNNLISQGFFVLDNGQIKFKSYPKYILYKDLYIHDFVSYHHQPKKIQLILDEEISKGHLRKEDNILSKQEADLFDYYLTDRFSDSLGIRNKYIHGSTETDEDILQRDYNLLIRMFLSLMIKIDDDLCTENKLKNL